MPARIPDEDLLADLQQVADELGRAPTISEYQEHGTHDRKTISNRFDGWIPALEAAGLDPDSRETGRPKGLPVSCPRCDHSTRHSGESEEYLCPSCSEYIPVWWGRIHQLERLPVLRLLAEGPKTLAELDRDPNQTARNFIERLRPAQPPRGADTGSDATTVLYLYGDDRDACRRFIEVNEEWVSKNLARGANPLGSDPDGALFQMLVQQWEWMDKIDPTS